MVKVKASSSRERAAIHSHHSLYKLKGWKRSDDGAPRIVVTHATELTVIQ